MENLSKVFIVLIFILLVIFSDYVFLNHAKEESYMNNLYLKHDLIENIDSPKLVMLGGSSMGWGVDSEVFDNYFDNYHVVNMGIHAGLGIEYILNDTIRFLSPGDILIISFEYDLWFGLKNDDLIIQTANLNPDFRGNIYNRYLYRTRYVVRKYIRDLLSPLLPNSESPYISNAINTYGDIVSHLNLNPGDINHNSAVFVSDNLSLIEFVNNELDKLNDYGVMTFVSFPPISRSYYEFNKSVFDEVSFFIKQIIGDHMISSIENYIYEDDMFFDTVYHLNAEGRQVRTNQLLTDLEIRLID